MRHVGRITRDRGDGTYDIDYDDGESEMRVKESMIRLIGGGGGLGESRGRSKEVATLVVGAKVEADYRGRGRYFPGRITRDRGDGKEIGSRGLAK